MKTNRTMTALLVALSMTALILTGCSDDDDDNPMNPGTIEGAMLRAVHASPDAPDVDIYVNDGSEPVITALGYGEASEYLDVPAGTYSLQIRAHGADPMSDPAFEVEALTLMDDQVMTAVAAGLLGSNDDADKFRVLPYTENFSDPGDDMTAVRIIHASADAPTVALDVNNDGTAEVPGFERFAETGDAGVALPAGAEIRLGVWAGEPLSRASVFTTPQLPDGGELFVIATGLLAGDPMTNGFSLLAVGPEGAIGFIRQDARAMVYALHGSPDAPAVDIDVNGMEAVMDLEFAELSGMLAVWPGAYDLDFRATGSMDVAASATTPYLEPGMSYLAIATGFLEGTPGFQLLPVADEFMGEAAVLARLVHASPDAPAVDVGPISDDKVEAIEDFTNLDFGDSSNGMGTELPVGELTVGVAVTGTDTPAVTFDLATYDGLRTIAVACGSLNGTGEGFRLVLVLTDGSTWSSAEVLPSM